ncbi:glycosyltransferase [Xenophilus azovorans]|uniref:glycosyltransferase n=1 Tax=Xenophilus azovorans TaxID=151755 RepID=UPI000570EAE4|nr:glycosyltransferase [Xenophilus azovorans]
MIGIAIPAHDEESHIEAAVAAALRAARHPGLANEACRVVVAADACSDATEARARAAGAWTVALSARNVGLARAEAARVLVQAGARWLAFTDADTRVSEAWLVQQLSLGADAVCGCVGVDDWSCHGDDAATVRAHFLGTYEDRDGHRHIHGANLGVSVSAYRRAGGFRSLACGEDVDFVRALEASGARIAWSARPRVTTSARRHARVVGGFADALLRALVPAPAATLPSTA